MKISNEAREVMLGSMNVVATEIVDGSGSDKKGDSVSLHLDTGVILTVECHTTNKGLVISAAMPVGPDDTERTGWCTCPDRPFKNPPVFDPDCPQHKDLIGMSK